MGARESGEAFLKSVLDRVPESRRADVEALIPELADVIGDGVLRQEEFSRGMDGIRAKHQEQVDWQRVNQDAIELGRKALAAGFDPSNPPSATPALTLPDDVVRRGDLEKDAEAFSRLAAYTPTLALQHYAEFGEVLDVTKLLEHPDLRTKGLPTVYAESVAAKRAERQAAATEKEIQRRADEEVSRRMKGMHNPSYPSAVPGGSPLDALAPVETPAGSVSEYVDAYETLKAGGAI